MSDYAIRIHNLSKAYVINHAAQERTRFVEVLSHRLRHPFKRNKCETIWAIKNINLDIRQGEVVGIIGRNGAGKSTLLKVLSSITEPTSGRIELFGRVRSLLEVGTGFHPELTGRENIYLNGAILGMRKKEISGQFDAIVDFAEIEKFLDTPVKRYSSGMYVRLAFAVAAHLEPEILLVDEVLAVGDVEFQKKCLGRMNDIAKTGERTILFVSHNIDAVRNLCSRAIMLQNGSISEIGNPHSVIATYLRTIEQIMAPELESRSDRTGTGAVTFTNIRIELDGKENMELMSRSPASIRLSFNCRQPTDRVNLGIVILTSTGARVLCATGEMQNKYYDLFKGDYSAVFSFGHLPLNLGRYRIHVAAESRGVVLDRVENAYTFNVIGSNHSWLARPPAHDNIYLLQYSMDLLTAN